MYTNPLRKIAPFATKYCNLRGLNFTMINKRKWFYRFSQMGTPALFWDTYAGRFMKSSCSAGNLTWIRIKTKTISVER